MCIVHRTVVLKHEVKKPFGKKGNDTALTVMVLNIYQWFWIWWAF